MPLIQHVWPWDSQPQEAMPPSELALSLGLRRIWTPAHQAIKVGPITAGSLGLGVESAVDNNTQVARDLEIQNGDNVWFVVAYQLGATAPNGNQRRLLATRGTTEGSGNRRGWELSASLGTLSSYGLQIFDASGNRSGIALATNISGASTTAVFTVAGNVRRSGGSTFAQITHGRDGLLVEEAEGSVTAFGNDTTTPSNFLEVGGVYAGSGTTAARVCVAAWGVGTLSAGMRLELARNPWQIFAARRIFVPVSASGGSYTLTCDPGTYTLTGQPAGLLASRTLAADAGAYALTGQPASLTRGRVMAADAGSYTLTGVAAVLAASRVLAADAGAYALTGQAVGLTKTTAGAYSLAADPGSYSLNGLPVNLQAARRLVSAAGTYALTGQAVGLAKTSGYTLTVATGSYALNGQAVGFTRTWLLQLGAGAYALTGRPVVLTYSGEAAPLVRAPQPVRLAAPSPSQSIHLASIRRNIGNILKG